MVASERVLATFARSTRLVTNVGVGFRRDPPCEIYKIAGCEKMVASGGHSLMRTICTIYLISTIYNALVFGRVVLNTVRFFCKNAGIYEEIASAR